MATVSRGVPVRSAVWLFHLALPLLGLWLLLAVPSADVLLEHHPTHFWLVVLVAAVAANLPFDVRERGSTLPDLAKYTSWGGMLFVFGL